MVTKSTFGQGQQPGSRRPSGAPLSPGKRFFFTRIFPWPFILVGFFALVGGVQSLYRAQQSRSWPSAEGRIQTSSVESRSGDHGHTYHASISYCFTVGREVHSGNKVAFGDYGSSDPSHAESIVNRYPVETTVQVRYLQTNPDVCVLEPGLRAQAWFLPGIGLVFFAAGTAMAVFLPGLARRGELT